MLRRVVTAAASVAVVVLVASGCTGGGDDAPPKPAPPPPPAEAVTAALTRATTVGTATFQLASDAHWTDSWWANSEVTGRVDIPAGKLALRVTIHTPRGKSVDDRVLAGRKAYWRETVLGAAGRKDRTKGWLGEPVKTTDSGYTEYGLFDPVELFRLALQAAPTMQRIGTGVVEFADGRAVPTTIYSGRADYRRKVTLPGTAKRPGGWLPKELKELKGPPPKVTVYVDDHGMPRRVEMAAKGRQTRGWKVTHDVRLDVSSWSGPIRITPPATYAPD